MPRNVRNFWIEARIEGRSTALEGGPQSRDGSIGVTLYMRDRGGVSRALEIHGYPSSDGKTVTLHVSPGEDTCGWAERDAEGCGFTITTER